MNITPFQSMRGQKRKASENSKTSWGVEHELVWILKEVWRPQLAHQMIEPIKNRSTTLA